MARLLVKCPYCNKIAEQTKSSHGFGLIFKTYSCGHTVTEKEIQIPANRDELWLQARPYQQAGVEFLEKSNFRALLADAMGLGKTIQVLLSIRYHWEDLTPTLYVVKSALKYQWAAEYHKWALTSDKQADLGNIPYIVTDGQMPILPGFRAYIVSMDLLRNRWEDLTRLGIKLLVVDESHNFKNGETKRTIHLKKLVSVAEIPYVICTSGTPILNRADEFFTTLNLLRPERFSSLTRFQQRWLEPNEKGKYTKIKSWALQDWRDLTSEFIIRREKREVLSDLPSFQRNFRWFEIEDQNLKTQYNAQVNTIEALLNNLSRANGFMQLFQALVKLRRLTGIAKIQPILDEVREFLDSEDDDKIIIGVEHKAVGSGLALGLQEFNPISISGEDSPESKFNKVEEFKKPENRVAIASIRACGEGLNLQFCSNMIIAERQWNAGKEEQFEGRIDRFGQVQNTTADYYVAKGTIDEYFTNMVEEKRRTVSETLGDEFNIESDPESMKNLAEMIVNGARL